MGSTIKISNDGISPLKHAWLSKITSEVMRAAASHSLIIPNRPVARLNNLTVEEESDCWMFARDTAAKTLQENSIKSVTIIVNDGIFSGQTVGHTHIHVLGFEYAKDGTMSFVETLNRLGSQFSTDSDQAKIDSVHLLDPMEFTKALRRLREMKTHELGQSASFSMCSDRFVTNISAGFRMIIKSCDEDTRMKYGLTNLTRLLRSPEREPYNWDPKNLDRVFEPI